MNEEKNYRDWKNFSGCFVFVVILAFCVYFIDTCQSKKREPEMASSSTTSSATSNYSNDSSIPDDPYQVMHIAFEGMPEKEDIQPMMEDVMRQYGMPINNENLLKVANMLLVLRKQSKLGVTEMEILKHIYQHGDISMALSDQAAISYLYLEKTK